VGSGNSTSSGKTEVGKKFPVGKTDVPVGKTDFPVGKTDFPVGKTEVGKCFPARGHAIFSGRKGGKGLTVVGCALSAVPHISNVRDAEWVQCTVRSLGSPSTSSLLRAVRAGYFSSFPRLTAKILTKTPPQSLATSAGHLDLVRQGQRSRKRTPPPSLLAVIPAESPISFDPEDLSLHHPFCLRPLPPGFNLGGPYGSLPPPIPNWTRVRTRVQVPRVYPCRADA
jgi:hypothetical protein